MVKQNIKIKSYFKLLVICLLFITIYGCSKNEKETPKPKKNTAQITTFNLLRADNPILQNDINATIDNNIVKLNVSDALDLTNLIPTITITDGATVSPASGDAVDFGKEVRYTVTAEDGISKSEYTIELIKLSSNKSILEFTIEIKGVVFDAEIEENANKINLTLPFATDLSSLAPVVSISEGSTIVPESGANVDFSNDVNYIITAFDGSKSTYSVQLNVMSGYENDRFVLEELYNLNKDYNTTGNYLNWNLSDADMNNWEGLTIADGRVTKICISENRTIKKLPQSIGCLTELSNLTIEDVGLEELPAQIGYLSYLKMLFLWSNSLSSLPAEIGNLPKLEMIILDKNELTGIPVEMCNLTSLKYLYISNNKITELPIEIGNLTSLVEFDLWKNQLNSLPVQISNLQNLSWLSISNNPLTSIPKEICNMLKPDGNPIIIDKDADDICE